MRRTESLEIVRGEPREGDEIKAVKRLMRAVLNDAVRCYYRAVPRTGAPCGTYAARAADAAAWFADTQADSIFAFENVCGVLAIDPSAMRAALREGAARSLLDCRTPGPGRASLTRLEAR